MSSIRAVIFTIAIVFAVSTPSYAGPTSGSVTNYGAVGDGVTDDTAAFNLCLTYNVICWVDPARKYAVGNVQMNNGNRLIGLGVNEYGTDTASTTSSRPVLLMNSVSGVTNILNVGAVTDGAAVEGLFIDCRAVSGVNGISGGSYQLSIQDITVVGCYAGIGSTTGSIYTTEAHISNSIFGGNTFGITNIIDSLVISVYLSNNSNSGMYLGSGANANTISNSRFEWNKGYGLESYGGTSNNSVSNSIFDRNYMAGIALVGVTGITISNSVLSKNGRNNTARTKTLRST